MVRGKMADFEVIGIMADSHGDADAIATAIRFFSETGCRQLVHLGDIGDSVSFDRLDQCAAFLQAHHVQAVKGNNDHAVVKNGAAVKSGTVSPKTAAYLAALPLQIEIGAALFVHSRPFADSLGLSAMTGEIGPKEAQAFMKKYPGRVLFRGHGHSPLVVRLTPTPALPRHPVPGERIRLDGDQGWIVTCGALYKGLCLTWVPETGYVTSHQL